ncbi:hypothetical protein [Klebsiella pneumoniae]|uniref:hypothetical protein n=1 Tax=Klebsiella pneumoniae TaxID=573 RepID=UPI001D1819BE|nr:hypothetical protein [Klebsiella pneumoniae]
MKMKAIGDYTMFTAESGLAAWGAVNVAMSVADGNNAAGMGRDYLISSLQVRILLRV